MLGTQNLSVFLLAAISLNLLPGANTLYIITRSIGQGRKAGIVSVLGISTGVLLHTTAAAFGLSAILATSAMFNTELTTAFRSLRLSNHSFPLPKKLEVKAK
ncbi:MAG: LysE family transporter [Xenococcaceae cyanobacterium MO_188.B29]|nr:LysE family transporter [Xenococcaceae cyanobacterium MO_188.B29]